MLCTATCLQGSFDSAEWAEGLFQRRSRARGVLTRLMLQQQQFSSWECLGCLSSRERCKFTQTPCSESKRRCSSLERPKACSLREAGARALPSPTAGRSLRLPPSDFGQLLWGYLNPGCPRCPSEHNGIISLLTLFPQHSPFSATGKTRCTSPNRSSRSRNTVAAQARSHQKPSSTGRSIGADLNQNHHTLFLG